MEEREHCLLGQDDALCVEEDSLVREEDFVFRLQSSVALTEHEWLQAEHSLSYPDHLLFQRVDRPVQASDARFFEAPRSGGSGVVLKESVVFQTDLRVGSANHARLCSWPTHRSFSTTRKDCSRTTLVS
jgi:hypothetical protein